MTRFFSLPPVSLARNPEKGLVDVSVSDFVRVRGETLCMSTLSLPLPQRFFNASRY